MNLPFGYTLVIKKGAFIELTLTNSDNGVIYFAEVRPGPFLLRVRLFLATRRMLRAHKKLVKFAERNGATF